MPQKSPTPKSMRRISGFLYHLSLGWRGTARIPKTKPSDRLCTLFGFMNCGKPARRKRK